MLFGRGPGHRLEPVAIVSGTTLDGPVLHRVGNNIRNPRLENAAGIHGPAQLLVDVLGQPLAHHRVGEYIGAIDIRDQRVNSFDLTHLSDPYASLRFLPFRRKRIGLIGPSHRTEYECVIVSTRHAMSYSQVCKTLEDSGLQHRRRFPRKQAGQDFATLVLFPWPEGFGQLSTKECECDKNVGLRFDLGELFLHLRKGAFGIASDACCSRSLPPSAHFEESVQWPLQLKQFLYSRRSFLLWTGSRCLAGTCVLTWSQE